MCGLFSRVRRSKTSSVLPLFAAVFCNVLSAANVYRIFDGRSYVEVPSSPRLSVPSTGALSISFWLRRDVLDYAASESEQYVNLLGKGQGAGTAAQQEWHFRSYSKSSGRPGRLSFYVCKLASSSSGETNICVGSYFENSASPVSLGQWIHVVGVVDKSQTYLYINGKQEDCDQYQPTAGSGCDVMKDSHGQPYYVQLQAGNAPLRIGTRDFQSWFQGAVAQVRVFNRALTADEISRLHSTGTVPTEGLVAQYLLNELAGSIAYDTAGNNNGASYGTKAGCSQGPPVSRELQTTAARARATADSSTSVRVDPTVEGDTNQNGYTQIEYATSALGPFTDAPSYARLAGPVEWRVNRITGLTPGVSYFIRVSHYDADGVRGQASQVVGPIVMPTSSSNPLMIGRPEGGGLRL